MEVLGQSSLRFKITRVVGAYYLNQFLHSKTRYSCIELVNFQKCEIDGLIFVWVYQNDVICVSEKGMVETINEFPIDKYLNCSMSIFDKMGIETDEFGNCVTFPENIHDLNLDFYEMCEFIGGSGRDVPDNYCPQLCKTHRYKSPYWRKKINEENFCPLDPINMGLHIVLEETSSRLNITSTWEAYRLYRFMNGSDEFMTVGSVKFLRCRQKFIVFIWKENSDIISITEDKIYSFIDRFPINKYQLSKGQLETIEECCENLVSSSGTDECDI